MVRWKSILVLALLLWLPLQGIASVAMPFCRHAESMQASTAHGSDSHAGTHDPATHAGGDTGHPYPMGADPHGGVEGSNLSCNDCGSCQLACAPVMASALWSMLAPPATSERIAMDPSALLTFIPEQPKRPPLRG